MNELQKQELITYRIRKDSETLANVERHIENEFWNSGLPSLLCLF